MAFQNEHAWVTFDAELGGNGFVVGKKDVVAGGDFVGGNKEASAEESAARVAQELDRAALEQVLEGVAG
jgi:hypothetical protein